MAWDLSCPDWQERIRRGQSLMPDMPDLDVARAERAVRIFNRLRIPDIVGTPLLADACGEWFREIVMALHGSFDPVTRARMIRELFILVPKKNAKTTLGAATMLTSVLMNERPRGEFLIVAPTKEVAQLAFDQATGMIDLDRGLKRRFHTQDHKKTITYLTTGATLKIKAFSPDVMTGVKPSGILVDEEHVVAERADADRVMGQIRGGMVSQPEAFLAIITTQSERPPRGVFKADLKKARSIRDGLVQGHTLPILYEFPPDIQKASTVRGQSAPWEDPSVWHMVLPNAGRSVTVQRLVDDFQEAKGKGLEELTRWASQHLNVEIGLALRNDRWAGADYWETQADPDLTIAEIIARSDVIVAGIDGGGLDDLLSLTIMGRDSVTAEWLQWSKSWVMEGVLQLRKREASQLQDFVTLGDLVIVQEPGMDIEHLADVLGGVNKSGKLAMVGLDPMGVGAIVDALSERGIGGPRVVGVSQGWTLSGAIKTAERKLADGSLLHCGQPIMAWAVSNAKVEARGNAIIITKQAAGYLKIDPLMSLLNAVVLMSKNPQAKPTMAGFMRRGLLTA
ncbi:terminase large subunit [Acetobacter indonesiensis]|uniref:terminase large subunit n=1 Tax=Acetobacter indonesiensis TaxID=104101 RepID=UPI001F2025A2|nr:terminase large subunit [Acetobacter indonesiensis]MCG0995297.1 terminase large subunit [Acetobacter indonesiensis]